VLRAYPKIGLSADKSYMPLARIRLYELEVHLVALIAGCRTPSSGPIQAVVGATAAGCLRRTASVAEAFACQASDCFTRTGRRRCRVGEHRGDGIRQAPDFAPGRVIRVPERALRDEDHAASVGQRLGDVNNAARSQHVLQAGIFQDVVRTPADDTTPEEVGRSLRDDAFLQRVNKTRCSKGIRGIGP